MNFKVNNLILKIKLLTLFYINNFKINKIYINIVLIINKHHYTHSYQNKTLQNKIAIAVLKLLWLMLIFFQKSELVH